MGGFGSGRWGWHSKRETVESSERLNIGAYLESLRRIERGELASVQYAPSWSYAGRPSGNVLLILAGSGGAIAAWLDYTSTNLAGQKTNHHYQVGLVSTLTTWGSRRYWWECPSCGGRCGTLYLPPSGGRFACRACHNLTYTTCQESHKNERFMSELMAGAGVNDMTPAEFDALLTWDRNGKPPKKLRAYFERQYPRAMAELQARREQEYQAAIARLRKLEEQEQAAKMAKLNRYLSAGDLCERAGLTPGELESLTAARLLVPDHEGKYRPKLAGWAGKLATLLHAGWDIDSIRRWSAGRWSTANPRAWPPDRATWQADS